MMPISPILLLILATLVAFGFLARPIGRLGLGERTALILLMGMLMGSLVELPLRPGVTLNLGTVVLPLLLALYLLLTCRAWWEPLGAIAGGLAAAASLGLLSQWLPPGPTELNLFFLDAQYFYALVAGVIAYLIAHTRPAAFSGAVIGVLGSDLYHYGTLLQSGRLGDLTLRVGGGGFHGTALVAGVLALTLADILTAAPVERGEPAVDHLPQP